MLDRNERQLWWCSSGAAPKGDDVFFGISQNQDGPFRLPGTEAADAAFTGNAGGGFDSAHVCDPNVIKTGGTYYLYYTGSTGGNTERGRNKIGLATSKDGRTWTRANEGDPIVVQSGVVHRDNNYGIGQPAAAHLDGWFYLVFTDTTAAGASQRGGGQFVLRSRDPAFQEGVEALQEDGFVATSVPSAPRDRSIDSTFSVDIMWIDALDSWAIARAIKNGTQIIFFSRDFEPAPYETIEIDGPRAEGPGFLRAPDGHAPLDASEPCGSVPIEVYRATTTNDHGAPTDIRRFSTKITGLDACPDAASTLTLLDGAAVPTPNGAFDLVVDGELLRITRPAVARDLAVQTLETRPEALASVSVTATVGADARAVRSHGRVGIVADDGRLWQVPSPTNLRGIPVASVPPEKWDSYEKGPELE